ncbi:MAG: protein phosphatase 2C domain-containing protein [bacterium]|nr:protein phosphatase 2C domain-containing protein [bacterium]
MKHINKKMQTIILYTKTDIGKERTTNEDSVASSFINSQSFRNGISYGVLAVADGMGGHEMGEVASEIAAKKFIIDVAENILINTADNIDIKFEEILSKAVETANKEVWLISKNQSNRIGTTLVGAIIANNFAYVVNIGDSRAYLKNKKSIIQITKDHSVVQEMLDGNMITKEQALNHPRENLLTKALGLTEEVKPDFFKQDLKDATLLLCTDGLYRMLNDKEISKTMNGNIYKSANALISLANKHGGIDNVSVAIAKYHD